MSIVVQKYGGSSVSDVDKLKRIAQNIFAVKQQGYDMVVVVSAMGKNTNSLIEMAHSISADPDKRELDMLLSTGERTAMALLSIALNEIGVKTISLTGSQSGIITNDRHNDATVIEVRPFRVQDELAKGKVVVIGGFQGVSYKRDITTLGRGGSDTSAVALAAALNAERCEIYSDVDGIYTADPNLIKDAKHLPEISYQQIQEMAEAGAKVLNAQAVQFAKNAKIAIYARSTFHSTRETVVRELTPEDKPDVIAVVYEEDMIRIIMNQEYPDLNGIVKILELNNISVKELNYLKDDKFEVNKLSFVISVKNIYNWGKIKRELLVKFDKDISIDESLSAVSLIGQGFSSDNRILIETISLFNRSNIQFHGLTTTSFRLSLLLKKEFMKQSVELLHHHWIK